MIVIETVFHIRKSENAAAGRRLNKVGWSRPATSIWQKLALAPLSGNNDNSWRFISGRFGRRTWASRFFEGQARWEQVSQLTCCTIYACLCWIRIKDRAFKIHFRLSCPNQAQQIAVELAYWLCPRQPGLGGYCKEARHEVRLMAWITGNSGCWRI